MLNHIIVNFLQQSVFPVVQYLFHSSFGFAKKDSIGMFNRFFGMKHG